MTSSTLSLYLQTSCPSCPSLLYLPRPPTRGPLTLSVSLPLPVPPHPSLAEIVREGRRNLSSSSSRDLRLTLFSVEEETTEDDEDVLDLRTVLDLLLLLPLS